MAEEAAENPSLTPAEKKAAGSLALVVGLRMFGLFLILPVFTLYAQDLQGDTPLLTGLAIGIYGLTQAMMQIPMGLLSDFFGRKQVIIAGMLLFIAGSVVAALADSILGVIAGRALQGLGAVASVSMALAADLSRDSQRTKVMAFIGMSIGLSFMVALLAAPVLAELGGLSGLFWITALLSGLGLLVFIALVPKPGRHHQEDSPLVHLGRVLRRGQLLRLNLAVMSLHLVLTGLFVALPLLLNRILPGAEQHWKFYLPAMVASVVFMVPAIIVSEKRNLNTRIVPVAFVLLAAALGLLDVVPAHYGLVLAVLIAFFTAFNYLESTLPAMLSRRVTSKVRGAAMGAYTTGQFFGAFLGGLLGGWLMQMGSTRTVYVAMAGIALFVAVVMLGVKRVEKHQEQVLRLSEEWAAQADTITRLLLGHPAIADAVVVPDEGLAYIRFSGTPESEENLCQWLRARLQAA